MVPTRRLASAAIALAATALLQAGAAAPARADEAAPTTGFGRPGPVRNRVNLRAGAASTDTVGRPTLCVEVTVVAALGVETCGTGAGLLHHEDGQEMAHFRAHWTALARALPSGELRLRGGLGFAELQLGDDQPGFQFGGPGGDRLSVAGPEASLSAQWLVPAWRDLDVLANLTAGAAHFSGAAELVAPQRKTQAFVSFELGVGW
ncbi:MAG: hypothetical protein KA297_19435 [Kofleriaceae bacterium]|jgi:hypothetical protein|nr:hypothetical protein [Kofleriaceae bacterium]MBP6836458.1 hypothetical protein [Kofleriaceae bacterium]